MDKLLASLAILLIAASFTRAEEGLAPQLRELDGRVIVRGKVARPPLENMLAQDVQARLRLANQADRAAWQAVKTRVDWERFRDQRVQALRTSLGTWPAPPTDLKLRVTRKLEGDGYQVENIVYESRPGVLATANLYRPGKPAASMPAILICHSHQSAKHTGYRQDMAMTWARAGCVVLVPDHLGHGERRQHPFGDESQHDYHFRYDLGIQLHLAGESLMGWLAWDLMRGVDLLLAQTDVDARRIVLISEPAGGGDVAGVTAALDPRITGVMVQNFGGPQPETLYPLPRDAEASFNYTGGGSWESTRSLRLSARDGFLPWTIVAASAPRKTIYYHEFYWDREQDPVWQRLQRVWGLHESADVLTGLAGRGFVVGSAPENSHWLAVNRELLYPVLERWFGIANPKKEYANRRPVEELLALTPEVRKEMRPAHVVAGQLADERTTAARHARGKLMPAERREQLRRDWARLLGDVAAPPAFVKDPPVELQKLGSVTLERIHLGTEPGIVVPALLLLPARSGGRLPLVIAVAQEGKQEFLRQRADGIADLLANGVAVCLPDLRGTGETKPGEARDRRSAATSLSASEWLLGQSLLGGRLRDLRALLGYLKQRPELDGQRFALWGDSFAPPTPADRDIQVSHAAASRPGLAEPLGGLLALLAALYEDDVKAVQIRGGLSDYRSALQTPFCYLPHDAVVPGVLAGGDLCDLAASLAPRPLLLEGLVDALNREVPMAELARRYAPALAAYEAAKAEGNLKVGERLSARWLREQLQRN